MNLKKQNVIMKNFKNNKKKFMGENEIKDKFIVMQKFWDLYRIHSFKKHIFHEVFEYPLHTHQCSHVF